MQGGLEMLSDVERLLLAKRRRAVKHLKIMMWVLPLMWCGIVALTAIRFPLLLNPYRVGELIQSRALGREDLESLALMAPIFSVIVHALVIAYIVGALVMLNRQRRLVEMVDDLAGEDDA